MVLLILSNHTQTCEICFFVCAALFFQITSSVTLTKRASFGLLDKIVHLAARKREALQRRVEDGPPWLIWHQDPLPKTSYWAGPISDHSWGCSSDTLPTGSWVVRDCSPKSQVLTRCAGYLDATPWQFLQLRLEGITLQTRLGFAVYACVRSFHDWLSRGGGDKMCTQNPPKLDSRDL